MDKPTQVATVNVPKDLLEPILQAHVAAALAEAIGGQENILGKAVQQVLSQTVDSEGRPSDYRGSKPWVQWVIDSMLREAVKRVLVEEMKKHEEVVRTEIARQLTLKNSPLVKQLITGMVAAVTDPEALKYRLSISYVEKSRD